MTLDRTCEPTSLGLANYFNHIAVSKLIDQHFLADIHLAVGTVQAKLFKNAGRRNSATGLFKVAAHRLGHVLQLDGLFVDESYLHRVVTISSGCSFLLHHDTGTSLNHGDWRNHAVRRKDLRHANFSSDDSVNH